MILDHLTPELLGLILSSLDSPQDLHSFIKASPACLRVFTSSRTLILFSVVKNAILPGALRHALYIHRIPKAHPGMHLPDLRAILAFLDEYLSTRPTGLPPQPPDLPDLVYLVRLIPKLSRFVDGYVSVAIGALGMSNNTWPLSPIEQTRLQRAFLRFEIYCRICPVDREGEMNSFLPDHIQLHNFLEKIEPWEVEEIICVHEYFLFVIGQHLHNYEEKFVQTVLEVPGLQCPHMLKEPSDQKAISNPYIPVCENEPMESFKELDLGELILFSVNSKYLFRAILSYMASLGLEFIDKLVSTDDTHRQDLFRRNTPTVRSFLAQALQIAGDSVGVHADAPRHDAIDNISQPNQGWLDSSHPTLHKYSLISDHHPSVLRLCGFVFWDLERFSQPDFYKSFEKGENMEWNSSGWEEAIMQYSPYLGQSAEARLEGFQVPKSEMAKLLGEFGQIYVDY